MTHRTLFPSDRAFFEPPKLARSSDPETSKLSAEQIRPHLGRLHRVVIATLKEKGEPMTAKEIGQDAHRRMLELVNAGMIETCGTRKCSVSGRMSQVYRITSKGVTNAQ